MKKKQKRASKRRGMADLLKTFFALVMVVVAGFSIWRIFNAKHVKTDDDLKKEYNITCDRMRRIARALDEDYDVLADIPKAKSIAELKEHVERYAPRCPLKDMWGKYFLFRAVDQGNFEIASAGSDGVFDGFDQEGEYSEFNGQDLIVERGQWKFAPKDAIY